MIKTELIQITKQELKESNEFYNSPNWKTLARFCNDCNKDTFKNKKDYYSVWDELWKEFGVGFKVLCYDCFEKRVGRKLTKEDFIDCEANKKVKEFLKGVYKK